MIDHFEIKVVDLDACVAFYSKMLTPLGIELKWSDDAAAGFGLVGEPNTRFLIEKGDQSAPCHIAFKAAVEAGFTSNGAQSCENTMCPITTRRI